MWVSVEDKNSESTESGMSLKPKGEAKISIGLFLMKQSPSKHSQIRLYADDTILYPVGPSPQSTAFSFKFSLTPLEESLHSLHPCLNIRKTKCILFSWRPDVAPSPMITGSDGTVLEHVCL